MHQRGARRASGYDQGNETQNKKIDIDEAGRAEKLGRIQFCLCLRSLKSMVTEEICGRFGPFDGSFICISTFLAMGFARRDYRKVSFTVWTVSCFLMKT